MSVETTVVDPVTGQEKKRLINRMRHRGIGPIALQYSDRPVRPLFQTLPLPFPLHHSLSPQLMRES